MRPSVQRHPYLAALAGGALVALSFPPRFWWPFAPIGVALLVLALEGRSWRTRALLGGATGVAIGATALAFISPSAPFVVVLAEAVAALVIGAFVAVVAAVSPPGAGRWLGLPAALVLGSLVQARWPFGGLPGIGWAFGQVEGPLAGLAPLLGPHAVVAAVAITGVGLATLAADHRRLGAVILVAIGLAVAGGAAAPAGDVVDEVRVAAVQGGGIRGVDAMPHDETFRRQLAAARTIAAGPELVVLAEGAAHVDEPARTAADVATLAALADGLDTTLVAGVIESLEGPYFVNSAFVWGPDGALLDRYDKVHGVPFAEYIPGREFLDGVVDLSLVPTDLVEGDELGIVETEAGTLGIAISFELFFSRLVRDLVLAGAEVIVVPTNAGSFDDGQVPAYEVAASRLRALEVGRWVVQVTPTGHSAIIDHRGQVLALTRLGEVAEILDRPVELRDGLTVYTRVGDLPVAVGAGAGLLGAWIVDRRRRTGGQPAADESDERSEQDGDMAETHEQRPAAAQLEAGDGDVRGAEVGDRADLA